MNEQDIQRLLEIDPEGSDQSNKEWCAVERSLGLSLPGAYKRLVTDFASRTWLEFLHVLSPFSEELNLQQHAEMILDADRETRRAFPTHYPIGLYPEPGGLFPWAVTDNGDTLYFITAGEPDDWPTLIKGAKSTRV